MMEIKFSIQREFNYSKGRPRKPLEATLVFPEEISTFLDDLGEEGHAYDCLKRFSEDLEYFFYSTDFLKEPSFKSEEMNEIEVVAYGVSFYPYEGDSKHVDVEPKYKPVWVDTGISEGTSSVKFGFTNRLSTRGVSDRIPSNLIIEFTGDAYYHLA